MGGISAKQGVTRKARVQDTHFLIFFCRVGILGWCSSDSFCLTFISRIYPYSVNQVSDISSISQDRVRVTNTCRAVVRA